MYGYRALVLISFTPQGAVDWNSVRVNNYGQMIQSPTQLPLLYSPTGSTGSTSPQHFQTHLIPPRRSSMYPQAVSLWPGSC